MSASCLRRGGPEAFSRTTPVGPQILCAEQSTLDFLVFIGFENLNSKKVVNLLLTFIHLKLFIPLSATYFPTQFFKEVDFLHLCGFPPSFLKCTVEASRDGGQFKGMYN